jgi:CubicO group peptidase (beta-lactamase class C family)
MKNIFIIIILAITISGCSDSPTANKSIQEVVEEYVAKGHFNGSILIAHRDNVIYQGSFGYANFETKDTITSSTLFPIASLTKQFTATAIMILQEKGKLSIDDKIGKYMEVPPTVYDIPIKNLMNMTSGLFDYWENDVKNDKDSILKFHYESDSLYFPTNSKIQYCNSNYFFLGLLIESLSGMTYNNFLSENIFKPAGMNNTFVYDGNEHKRAIGYDENRNIKDYLITTADGGMFSTLEDLHLWDKALSENKILTKESKNRMFIPMQLDNGDFINYGFGWEVGEKQISLFSHLFKKPKNIVSHAGGLAGFAAYNQYDIDNDLYFIILSNQRRIELFGLKDDVHKALYKDFK